MIRLEEYGVTEELSRFIVDYIEEVRELLSSDLWENIFLIVQRTKFSYSGCCTRKGQSI